MIPINFTSAVSSLLFEKKLLLVLRRVGSNVLERLRGGGGGSLTCHSARRLQQALLRFNVARQMPALAVHTILRAELLVGFLHRRRIARKLLVEVARRCFLLLTGALVLRAVFIQLRLRTVVARRGIICAMHQFALPGRTI